MALCTFSSSQSLINKNRSVTEFTGLSYYYTFNTADVVTNYTQTNNGVNLANYSTGSAVYDASLSSVSLISSTDYAISTPHAKPLS